MRRFLSPLHRTDGAGLGGSSNVEDGARVGANGLVGDCEGCGSALRVSGGDSERWGVGSRLFGCCSSSGKFDEP